MKYLYFDCYAGFDVEMALGSLVDMTKDAELARQIVLEVIPEAILHIEETKRQSMEATLASLEFGFPEERTALEIAEEINLDDEIKTKLKLWLKLKSDGKKCSNINEIKELIYCAACLGIIKSLEAEKVFASAIYQGSGVSTADGSITVIPSLHTELLAKMAGIHTASVDIEKEILTPGGIMLLYVLGAKHMPPKAHNVIKSGYGAGAENLSIPNITRCILATDDEDNISLNLEAMFSEMNTEFGALAKSE